ncbi:MAG: FKBP-type peptidyl-prolyl cis-trans isomerase [Paludibacteraceae bacterium]|nr:FKBP-type peptidyl-prolyl cis-trans isomerase [Paludibacteraceae bacterium]
MKQTCLYTLLIALLVLFGGCKKNKWIDWKTQNAVWLAVNKQKEGVITTPTGLQYKVLHQGIKGTKPDMLKNVRIRYSGTLITGNVYEPMTESSFAVSDVVEGLAEGLKKMTQSGHYIFYIPQELGYGSNAQGTEGYDSFIPPYSTLIIDVELLEVY